MNVTDKCEIESFFKKLFKACNNENVYSVIETAEKMGVSYDQVRAWARKSKQWSQILKGCRRMCYEHCLDETEEDGVTKKISMTDVVKYMEENNDEFKSQQEKQEAEYQMQRLQHDAERKGKEFPPDKIERILMPKANAKKNMHVTCTDKSENQTTQKQTFDEIEAQRINEWKAHKFQTRPSYQLKQTITEDETGKKETKISWELSEKKPQVGEIFASSLYAATGCANEEYAYKLITQIAVGSPKLLDKDLKAHMAETVNESMGVLLSLAPKDEIEGMLCARMLVLQAQYMNYMGRAALPEQTSPGIEQNLNRATKLMRLFNETLDALNKHRRKGEQKVTVQHVNVNNGGQAIVNGQLNQGEGETQKNEGADHAD